MLSDVVLLYNSVLNRLSPLSISNRLSAFIMGSAQQVHPNLTDMIYLLILYTIDIDILNLFSNPLIGY